MRTPLSTHHLLEIAERDKAVATEYANALLVALKEEMELLSIHRSKQHMEQLRGLISRAKMAGFGS